MASQAKDTIIIRVNPNIKRAARRGAKVFGTSITKYISHLILVEAARMEQGAQMANLAQTPEADKQ